MRAKSINNRVVAVMLLAMSAYFLAGVLWPDSAANQQSLASEMAGPGQIMNGPPLPPGHVNPAIINFDARPLNGIYWMFEGQVTGSEVSGLVVKFGGLLLGHTTGTTPNGYFSYTYPLGPTPSGAVTSQTKCPYGIDSNIASYSFF